MARQDPDPSGPANNWSPGSVIHISTTGSGFQIYNKFLRIRNTDRRYWQCSQLFTLLLNYDVKSVGNTEIKQTMLSEDLVKKEER
jgi:hypothetical protein